MTVDRLPDVGSGFAMARTAGCLAKLCDDVQGLYRYEALGTTYCWRPARNEPLRVVGTAGLACI